MPDDTNNLIRAARPTIALAGSDKPALAQGLLSLLIVENTNGLYRCEAVFGNWGNYNNTIDFLYFDRQLLDFGKELQIKLGTQAIFTGRIMAIEAQFPNGHAPTIAVLAEDRFQDLRMTRRTRTFERVSDADVIRQIAADHGLQADVDLPTTTYRVVAQVNQSDLAFLRDRARAIDADVWVDNKTLHAKRHPQRQQQPLTMTYGKELHEFSVLADLAHQRTAARVTGWDVSSKETLNYEATDQIISTELHTDQSGAAIVQSVFGTRKETLAHTVPLTSQQAQATAEAFFKLTARRFVVGRGVAEIHERLRVGNSVDLKGLGKLFSGTYYLSEVRHIFDGVRGIRSEFVGERPGLGRV